MKAQCHSNGNGKESFAQICRELQAGLDRTLDQQRIAQRELLEDFVRQVIDAEITGQAQDTDAKITSGMSPMQIVGKVGPFSGMPALEDAAPYSSSQPGDDLSTEEAEAMFRKGIGNSAENDMEWLEHAVLQPAVRGTRAKLIKKGTKNLQHPAQTEEHHDEDVVQAAHSRWKMGHHHEHTAITEKILEWYARWTVLEEPERHGRLHDLIASKRFNALCVLVILFNAAVLVYSTDADFDAKSRGLEVAGETQSHLRRLEYVFLSFYVLELTAKLMVHKMYFFVNDQSSWNILDLALVVSSCIDAVRQLLMDGGGTSNLSFLRTLRVLRVSQVIRIFRALQFVAELRTMLDCLLGCLYSLLWAIVLLLFLNSLFSIFFVQGVTSYMESNRSDITPEEGASIRSAFGSVNRAMMTLFQSTTGGADWGEHYDTLVPVGSLYSTAFNIYVVFMMFSVFNIVTSIFVDRALRVATPTQESILANLERENREDEHWLYQLCKDLQIDQKGDGLIEYEDLLRCMSDERVREHFDARGISFEDTHTFYQMLTMGSQGKGITVNQFVTGCIRLKGKASNMDMHTMAFELKLLHRSFRDLDKYCKAHFTMVAQQLGQKPACPDAGALPARRYAL